MCYNCGCDMPDDNMGNDDNITNHTFHHLAEKWGKTEEEAKKIVLAAITDNRVDESEELSEMFTKAAAAENQTIDEAKKETEKLIKKTLGIN